VQKITLISLLLIMLFGTACENTSLNFNQETLLNGEPDLNGSDLTVRGESFCGGVVVTRSSALNVRTSPEIADNICAKLDKSAEVLISLKGSVNGFFKIETDVCALGQNEYAYVSKKFISFDQSCAFEKNESIKDTETELPPVVEEQPEGDLAVIAMNWDRKHESYKSWTSYAYEAVSEYGQDLMASNPEDIQTFCPKYRSLQSEEKKMFWMHLISSMVEFESGFKPEAKFQESFKDRNGEYIISRGLLQISIESAGGYSCRLNSAKDLHSARLNLECGVRILNRWVKRDGRVAGNVDGTWVGGARYWSVLRKRASSRSHDRIAAKTTATSICR